MLAQVNMHQDIQVNQLSSNNEVHLRSMAMIKNALGEEIMITWGEEQLEASGVQTATSDLSDTHLNSSIKTAKEAVILEQNIETSYGISLKEAFNIQSKVGGKIQKNGAWVSATAQEVKQYFEPTQDSRSKYRFQFLNLASLAGISETDAKEFLKNKGILSGKETTFLEAAKVNNINEVYLMAHACLETGNGTSKLATGINYKGKVVYNMFGIGAVDSNPILRGAEYAYNMDWTTPEKAILGGAKFISTKYINNYPYNQDTLYEMRWNPASPGKHQYATDIAWATKQAVWMERIYSSFKNATLTFDIPMYRGMSSIVKP